MTEKQRWLLRDLESWASAQMEKIGKYGPPRVKKDPPHVRAAKRAEQQARSVIARWERDRKQPWETAKNTIYKKRDAVKRVILFEKTEDALKALKALK